MLAVTMDVGYDSTYHYTLNTQLPQTLPYNTHYTHSSSAEDKENAELSAKWTLRKQAALLLDTVAVSFPPADVLSAGMYCVFVCIEFVC